MTNWALAEPGLQRNRFEPALQSAPYRSRNPANAKQITRFLLRTPLARVVVARWISEMGRLL
jgi:hypothetical protein